jgi:hypothetical protein
VIIALRRAIAEVKQRWPVIGYLLTHSVGAVTQSECWPPAREFATYLDRGRCPAKRLPTVREGLRR